MTIPRKKPTSLLQISPAFNKEKSTFFSLKMSWPKVLKNMIWALMKHISFRFNWFNDQTDNFQIQVIQRLDFVIHWFIRNREKSLIHKEKEYVKKKDSLGESSDWKMKKQNTHFTSPGQVTKSPLKRYWFRGEGSSLMMSFCCKNDETCHFALAFVLTLCKNLPSWKGVFSSWLSKFRNCVALLFLVSWIFVCESPWVVKKTTHGYQPIGLSRQVAPHISNKCKRSQNWPCKSPTTCLRAHRRRVKKTCSDCCFWGFFFNPRSFAL